jgi:hypothetical protein
MFVPKDFSENIPLLESLDATPRAPRPRAPRAGADRARFPAEIQKAWEKRVKRLFADSEFGREVVHRNGAETVREEVPQACGDDPAGKRGLRARFPRLRARATFSLSVSVLADRCWLNVSGRIFEASKCSWWRTIRTQGSSSNAS